MHKIIPGRLNVRGAIDGQVKGTLVQGTEVAVKETKAEWSRISFSGWVNNKFIKDDTDKHSGQGALIKRIVIHCSATPEGRNFTAEDIKLWHTGPKSHGHRGWNTAGYHWVIQLNPARVVSLVPLDKGAYLKPSQISNGARGYNKNSIHVCYIGGVDKNNKYPKDTITPEQKQLLIKLLKELVKGRPGIEEIIGHNDLDPSKACPSFKVPDFLKKSIKDRVFFAKYIRK